MKGPKQWFVLIQTPVRSTGVSYPYALRVIHSGIYPNALPFFEKKRREWEREGCSGHLSKREIEDFGCFPPVGPRVHLVPLGDLHYPLSELKKHDLE